MSALTIALCVILPLLALVLAVVAAIRCMDKTHSGKKAFGRHVLVLALSLIICFSCMAVAFADNNEVTASPSDAVVTDMEAAKADDSGDSDGGIAQGLSFIGAALAIGLAAIGAVAEDPKSFGKAMIFVALGEAVAIYGFIIAFLMILPTLQ